MPLFRQSERGIGRGEVAESRLEAPIFAVFLLFCSLLIILLHLYVRDSSITVAAAVSMMVFGVTVARVDVGVYILVIAMMFSPEIEAGNQYSGERSLNLRYDDILIVVIFLGVMAKLAYEGRLRLWEPTPINGGIVAYYAVCCFSTLLALKHNLPAWDRRTAFFVMLKMLEFYMVFFMVVQSVRSLRGVRKQLTLFFVVAALVSLYGIYTIGTTPRISAPFEKGGTEPNTLGGYLVIVICVSMGLLTQAKQWSRRIPLIAITLLAFVPMLYTLSRASYLAFITGMIAVGLVSRKFVLLALLGATLAASPLLMPHTVQERVLSTLQSESVSDAGASAGEQQIVVKVDKSTEERFLVWRKVRYILFTVGGVFALFGGGISWETVMDSQYARVILETGLLGLSCFLVLQLNLLRSTRQSYRWTSDWVGRGLSMGMFAATLALIVHSVGTISFLIVRIMEPYWFLVAMTVYVRNQAIAEHAQRRRAQAQTPPRAVRTEQAPAPGAVHGAAGISS